MSLTPPQSATYQVESRLKSEESFLEKARRYADPVNEIEDLAAVRVTTFVTPEAKGVIEQVQLTFDVTDVHDKGLDLGTDRFGYRSTHFVIRLPTARSSFPEMKRFEGLKAEIQVRTLLQHAWAEIEHDRRYKFVGKLPDDIHRSLNRIAAQLETADREFGSVVESIEIYRQQLAGSAAPESLLGLSINTISLDAYLRLMVPAVLPEHDPQRRTIGAAVSDLLLVGLQTIRDLHTLVPSDFVQRSGPNLTGLTSLQVVALILVISDRIT